MMRRLVMLALVSGATTVAGCGSGPTIVVRSRHTGFVSEPVHYLSGGLQTVATVPVPGAVSASIVAKRYRFQGKVYFNLADNVHELDGGQGGGGFAPEGTKSLSWTMDGGCSIHPPGRWVIFYGLLRVAADQAFAYTAHRRYPLSVARIPSNFQAAGLAAYAVLSEPPIRVVVQTSAGGIVQREELEPSSKEPCHPGSIVMYFTKHR